MVQTPDHLCSEKEWLACGRRPKPSTLARGKQMEMIRVIWGFLQKSSDSRARTVLCILNSSLRRNNDLAWIGRWNGRNHGGLENASAARWKNGPTRELHHVLQSHPGRRGSLCRRNHRHLFHFQILPGILPEHPRYLRLKLFFRDILPDIQNDCRYGNDLTSYSAWI